MRPDIICINIGVMLNYNLRVPVSFFSTLSKTAKIDTCLELEGFQDIHWNNCQIISVHFATKSMLQGSYSVAKVRGAAPLASCLL